MKKITLFCIFIFTQLCLIQGQTNCVLIEGKTECEIIESPLSCLQNGEVYCLTLKTNFEGEPPPMCDNGVISNPSWFSFIAQEKNLDLQFCPANCQGVPGGFMGIQAAIYSDCPFNSNNVIACQPICQVNCFHLITNALKIGETYYLLIDGCAGDVCDVTIECVEGCNTFQSNPITGIQGPSNLCKSESGTWNAMNINCGFKHYAWTIDGIAQTIDSGYLITSFPDLGVHAICVEGYNVLQDTVGLPDPVCKIVEVNKFAKHKSILGPQLICPGDPVTFTAIESTCPSLHTLWTVNGVPQDSTQHTIKLQLNATGNYEICAEAYNVIQDTLDNTPPICTSIEVQDSAPYHIILPIIYICQDTMFEIKGTTVTGKTNAVYLYQATVPNSGLGCDTVFHITVAGGQEKETMLPPQFICTGDTFYIHGTPFTDCGNYTHAIPQQQPPQCDSVLLFSLFVAETEPYFTSVDTVKPPLNNLTLDASLSKVTVCGEILDTTELWYNWTFNGILFPNHTSVIFYRFLIRIQENIVYLFGQCIKITWEKYALKNIVKRLMSSVAQINQLMKKVKIL